LTATLTDASAAVYALPLEEALGLNRLARALRDTTSLADAEQVTRGFSEIDYERKRRVRDHARSLPCVAVRVDRTPVRLNRTPLVQDPREERP
jgi:hypothetical protein